MKAPAWDPFTDWRPTKINWIKVDIAKEDLRRFMERSNLKGLFQTICFLLIISATAALSYYAFTTGKWLLMVLGLYLHGMIYSYFGAGIHELIHNTVFKSKTLNKTVTFLFGLLYWPYNPYFYRLSHVHFHHQYTLYQNSDGEDTPNYVDLSFKSVLFAFFRVLHVKTFIHCIGRLLTLKPLSKGWRSRGYKLDQWEKFILEKATAKERKQVHSFTIVILVFNILFVTACILSGYWFLLIIITLAPFYGPSFHIMLTGAHMHSCCLANNPDFRLSCGDAKVDPISSILYWHMEFHTEHHMFPSIPCYNLKKFGKFVADQMPEKEPAFPRLLKLAHRSKEMFGSPEEWRENFGRYKGF